MDAPGSSWFFQGDELGSHLKTVLTHVQRGRMQLVLTGCVRRNVVVLVGIELDFNGGDKDFKGLHPSPFGHQLYANSIARMLDDTGRSGEAVKRKDVIGTPGGCGGRELSGSL